jgi:hypothetical protein
MCFHLYGGINIGVNKKDYNKISSGHFSFIECTKAEIKHSIDNCDSKCRITKRICDCNTALGTHEKDNNELSDLSIYINQLRKVRGIKHVFISKNWWEDKLEKEYVVHIDDIDIIQFLADIECNCLYKIQLFRECIIIININQYAFFS